MRECVFDAIRGYHVRHGIQLVGDLSAGRRDRHRCEECRAERAVSRCSGGQQDFGQAREVDRLVEPLQYIEPGRSHVLAPAPGISGNHDDRRVTVIRLGAQVARSGRCRRYPQAAGGPESRRNGSRRRARERRRSVWAKSTAKPAVRSRMRMTCAMAGSWSQSSNRGDDAAASTSMSSPAGAVPGRQFDMKDRPAAGRVIEADLPAEPLDDLLDDAEAKPGSALPP